MTTEDTDATRALEAAAAQRADNFENVLSGFGGKNDPMNRIAHRANVPNSFGLNEQLFESEWIVRRVIESIPEDATREWIEFSVKDNEKSQDIEQKVNSKMEELDLRCQIEEAFVLSRLYGGSIAIITTNGGGKPEEPLNENDIQSITSLNLLDRWQVDISKAFDDPLKPNFGEPELYRLSPVADIGTTTITQSVIHSSRVVRFDGDFLPKRLRIKNNGWHRSIIESINDAVTQHGVALQSCAVLMQDFITKVLKIPDLANIISNQETATKTLETRIQFALSVMSSVGISVVGEDEEFTKFATPGVKELVKVAELFIDNVAAASGIPKSRLFNQQLGQLAGAEETTRAYFDWIRGLQNKKLRKQLNRIITLILKSKEIGGEPETWGFTFNSLWQPTALQQAEEKQRISAADKNWTDAGVLDPDEVAESRFTDDGFSQETTLDKEARQKPKEVEKEDQEGLHVHRVGDKLTGPPIPSPSGGHRHEFEDELTSLAIGEEKSHKHKTFDQKETGPPVERESIKDGGKGKQRKKTPYRES